MDSYGMTRCRKALLRYLDCMGIAKKILVDVTAPKTEWGVGGIDRKVISLASISIYCINNSMEKMSDEIYIG